MGRCFVAGWGEGRTEGSASLELQNSLKFTNVKIVDPLECKRVISGDAFLADEENHKQIICAEGYVDANTCGGDSGGGLYCFDKSGSNYYYMGPLHGGSQN